MRPASLRMHHRSASLWEDGAAVADWARASGVLDQLDDEVGSNAFGLFRGEVLEQRGA